MAANAPTVVQIRGLVDWVGGGRALTQTGRLRRADALMLVDLWIPAMSSTRAFRSRAAPIYTA